MDKYNQFIIRLRELEQLEHDWDGDDAYPPSQEAVKQMRVVLEWLGLYFPKELTSLSIDSLYCTSYGTLKLAWFTNRKLELSIETGKDGCTYFIPERAGETGDYGYLNIIKMLEEIKEKALSKIPCKSLSFIVEFM